MLTFKPKKVFEKLNKMDRKQAYTIGAIVIVSVVALLMLVSAVSTRDESFEGMAARGYDLANMPFATDQAEQYLLASKYPDMRENGSTLLYSAAEKEARQEEDAQALEEEQGFSSASDDESPYEDNTSAARSDNGGYGGYAGRRGGSSRGQTEIGQLSSSGMASAGGSGFGATYGPTGDFRQFKGRENKGNEAPVTLNTGNARQALAQFRQGSRATASFKENKMTGARKALMGGNVAGSEAVGKDGVDLSKLQSGGLTLDTDAPPSSTDLDNLDKQVADAAKKAEEQKKNEEKKLSFWEQLGQDLLRQMATSLVSSIMDGVGDTIKGGINGQRAYYSARRGASNDVYKYVSSTDKYDANNPYGLTKEKFNEYRTDIVDNKMKPGSFYRTHGKTNPYASSKASSARTETSTGYNGSTHNSTQIGQTGGNDSGAKNPCPSGQNPVYENDGKTYKCK
ncbi:MAG: hypothetical protein IJ876_03560 [Elusimicrobiaceae bacterium]|nr:hypothetical protein [Elusimicrobiaceae bacterium]